MRIFIGRKRRVKFALLRAHNEIQGWPSRAPTGTLCALEDDPGENDNVENRIMACETSGERPNPQALAITVSDAAALGSPRPVTGGVPQPEGSAPEGSAFMLHDSDGRPVPLQTRVLARWKDNSTRWLLLDFQSSGDARYALSVADAAPAAPAVGPMPECEVPGPGAALARVADRVDVELTLTNERGDACAAIVESSEIEVDGPLRRTYAVRGAFHTPGGERVFQFRLRVSLFAGSSLVRLEPLILVDAQAGIIQHVRELKLALRPIQAAGSAAIGGEPGWEGRADSAVRLFQYDDEHYRFEGADAAHAGGEGDKAPGWAVLDGTAVALRDFWRQWPKSLEVSAEGLSVGLLPRFSEGDFAHMEPWYKHQYFFEGESYRLRTGQARRWDVWLDLAGDGRTLAAAADAPLVPAADPAQAIATGVWDAIAPAGAPEMADYDPWAEGLFNAYCESIRTQRDYGAMNWGDWFGERRVNWGNHEYDTANQLLIQFARTGDPKYFLAADAAARHSTEVDVVHFVNDDLAAYFNGNWATKGYPPRAGMVHEHSVGHVGSFYPVETIRKLFVEHGVGNNDRPYLCLDPFNLGHIWTQGMARHYFLTGDPFVKETVETIGDNLVRLVEDGEFDFAIEDAHFGRAAGWPLLALAGAYEIDFDDRFLAAMRNLADRALARQDPHCGGWLYSLYPGHCFCTTRSHVGMAGFITSVLVNGLSRYYLLTGDERLVESIDRAVTFLDNDTWREEHLDWRYTSCPASNLTHRPGVVVMAHVNGVRIADNPAHLRVLRLAWRAKFEELLACPPSGPGQGKTYTSKMYGCAEAAGLLAARAAQSTDAPSDKE